MTRIGINGFGRMGRLAFAPAGGGPICSSSTSTRSPAARKIAAHLLTFDSVHGRWERRVERSTNANCRSMARPVSFFERRLSPGDVAWSASAVDIVLECSGKFRTTETLEPYFSTGVKKVIVAAPVKSGALNIVMGVNDHLYDPATHRLLTAASCTTNCLAPVVKVIHEGDWHPARRHHDHPRHHQHAGRRRCAAQGFAAGACEQPLVDSDQHRLGNGDRRSSIRSCSAS